MRPGDARTYATTLRMDSDPELGELVLELTAEAEHVERWFLRRGRVFQVDEQGHEIAPGAFGDLAPAAIAALHPRAIASALAERRADWSTDGSESKLVFAWNDVLWHVELDPAAGRVLRLERAYAHPLYADRTEEIRFEEWPQSGGDPRRVVVRHDALEVARFELTAATSCEPPVLPAGDRERGPRASGERARDPARARRRPPLQHRPRVPEHAHHRGGSSPITSSSSRAATAPRHLRRRGARGDGRARQTVRAFAFSHLHGQYVGACAPGSTRVRRSSCHRRRCR
jgi:hypothetical protein